MSQVDSVVYHELLCEMCPKLVEVFGESHLREFSTLLAMKWYMSGFVDLLPMSIMLWLWDSLMCRKDTAANTKNTNGNVIFRRLAIFQVSATIGEEEGEGGELCVPRRHLCIVLLLRHSFFMTCTALPCIGDTL